MFYKYVTVFLKARVLFSENPFEKRRRRQFFDEIDSNSMLKIHWIVPDGFNFTIFTPLFKV